MPDFFKIFVFCTRKNCIFCNYKAKIKELLRIMQQSPLYSVLQILREKIPEEFFVFAVLIWMRRAPSDKCFFLSDNL